MQRILLYPFLLVWAAALVHAAPLTPDERQAGTAYVQELQNADGGFRSTSAVGPSQLGPTNSSLRAIKYFGGGEIPKRRDVGLFVLSCMDPASGGFSDVPGGSPDVRSTAMGLMALAELGTVKQRGRGQAAAGFLEKNAKTLPEIYIAAAAMDAAGLKSARAAEWIAAYQATRNPDGSYGKTPADTAGAVITILRLGGSVSDRAAVVRALQAAQRPDGGFAASGEASDLGTVYRVLRAFRMLEEKPDVRKVRAFVARCRNQDGGYSPAPGQPSNASTTYFAAIVSKWLDEMEK